MREAEELLLARPENLTGAHGRVALLRAWTDVLVEAAERVEREDRWGELYEEEPDDGFAAASSKMAGAAWPEA